MFECFKEDVPKYENDGSDVKDDVNIITDVPKEEESVLVDDEVVAPLPSAFHWIIDMGHGGKTKGKRSPKMKDGRQFLEWEFNNYVGTRISEELEKLNIKHSLIPPDQKNRGNDLKYRVDFVNNLPTEKPKILVSIHANAGPVKNPKTDWSHNFSGVEVWHFTPSPVSKNLAKIFQQHLVITTGLRNRGIKSKDDGQFYVLKNTRCPAVLTENGFYNNPKEVLWLMNTSNKEKIVLAHVNAIKQIELNGIN